MRIVGINTDKCRRIEASESTYRIYFLLSENPGNVWKQLFDENWKALNATAGQLPRPAGIDGGFLYAECSLEEVSALLPALNRVVAETSISYKKYLENHDQQRKAKEAVWNNERKSVEEMAGRLRF